MKNGFSLLAFCTIVFGAGLAFASGGMTESVVEHLNLTTNIAGITGLMLFIIAIILVVFEEQLGIRKSLPVLFSAGIIWSIIGYVYKKHYGANKFVEDAINHNILEYSGLFLFLLVAMTYINSMEERNVFQVLRYKLVNAGCSLKKIFWITGVLSFIISPIADNLTTALLMGAVIKAIGKDNTKFMVIAFINIVIAANAGGAFSPFGDITTLMVWQKGLIEFWEFKALFIPSLVNWLIPAIIMSFAIAKEQPEASEGKIELRRGAKTTIFLFLLTIATAVIFHNALGLPAAAGMMFGLGYLQLLGDYLSKTHDKYAKKLNIKYDPEKAKEKLGDISSCNVFKSIARAEWDTLIFFYGILISVGGLDIIGYLSLASNFMYEGLGHTTSNVIVGVLSAIVDNIPVMFSVLSMNPDMSHGQWLLVTLTAGVGGSLLSIGSAAGVALMGQAHRIYTFGAHLKWTPVIALGYAGSIITHLYINAHLM